jgi:O-antigen ligase
MALGTLFFDPVSSVAPVEKFQLTYSATIIILWGVASYVAGLARPLDFDRFLRFVRNTFLIASGSVWASPILYQLYVNVAAGAEQRMGGFFGNPNEAAYAALIAMALVLNVPYRNSVLQGAALTLASGAVVLTFSKAGMLLLIIVVGLHLFLRANGAGKLALMLMAILLVLAIQNANSILRYVLDLQLFELSSYQQSRILAVGEILGGRIDEETTTRRSVLWALTIERSWEKLPVGSGLGSYHNIVGGILENGVWQGSHNVFLMILGESGALPVLLLIGAMIGTGYGVLRLPRAQVELMLLLTAVLLVSMMAGHAGLGVRYQNLTLGIVLGVIAASLSATSHLSQDQFVDRFQRRT